VYAGRHVSGSPTPRELSAGSDSPSLGDQEGLDLVPAGVGILVAEFHDPPKIIRWNRSGLRMSLARVSWVPSPRVMNRKLRRKANP